MSTVVDSNRAISKRLHSHEDLTPSLGDPFGHRRRRPRRNGAPCTCRPSSKNTYLPIYGLQLFCSQETSHSPNCPHWDGSTLWSCGVRALGPKIQMMVGVQLGGWTLGMVGRLTPHNMVDRRKSPAFIAMDKAYHQFVYRAFLPRWNSIKRLESVPSEPCIQEGLKTLFNTLIRELREAFESGKASPSDHMPNGRTLLHVRQEMCVFQSRTKTIAGICSVCDASSGFS